MKDDGRKIVGVVAWDYQIARIVDRVGVDIVSVGDTVGVNLWGHANPFEVTLDEMLTVTPGGAAGGPPGAGQRGLPVRPAAGGRRQRVRAAIRFVKEAGVDLVKLDGGGRLPRRGRGRHPGRDPGLRAVRDHASDGAALRARILGDPPAAARCRRRCATTGRRGQAAGGCGRRPAELHQLRPGGGRRGGAGGVIPVSVASAAVRGSTAGCAWSHAAIGYAAAALDGAPDTYANVAKITFDALTAYADDVRAARQIPGGIPVPGVLTPDKRNRRRAHRRRRRDHHALRGRRGGPSAADVLPWGLRLDARDWRTVGVYKRLALMDHLTQRYTCITFDRRESGRSGGRLERISWADYVRQAIGLLDALGVDSAHLMGGCVGCSAVVAIGVAHPERVRSMVLYSPAGGVKYRMKQHSRFEQHLAFVDEHGLRAVVDLARETGAAFARDPRVGPWNSVSAPTRRSPTPTPPLTPGVPGDGGRPRPADVRPRHRAGGRARGPAAPRRPGVDRPRAGRVARTVRGPLPAGGSSPGRLLGRARDRADRGDRPGPGAGIPRRPLSAGAHAGLRRRASRTG